MRNLLEMRGLRWGRVERVTRLELATSSLARKCSTNLARPHRRAQAHSAVALPGLPVDGIAGINGVVPVGFCDASQQVAQAVVLRMGALKENPVIVGP